MYYSFDVNKWIAMLIPGIMRKRFLYALLKALLYPLFLIYSTFDTYRKDVEDKLTHNAFTIYLEKYLNGHLHTTGIYIVDRITEQTLYLSSMSEADTPDYMAMKSEGTTPVYVSNSDRLIGSFLVMVPASIATAENLDVIRRWVDYYKYAGTQYDIKIY